MSTLQRSLRSRAVTRRSARVSDGEGGWTEGYADYLLDVRCRRRPVGDSDTEIAEQLAAVIAHVVYFEPTEDVVRGDQVVVDGYELVLEATTKPSRARYLTAACSETQLGA